MTGADVEELPAGRKGPGSPVCSGESEKILFRSFLEQGNIPLLFRVSFLFPECAGPDGGMYLSGRSDAEKPSVVTVRQKVEESVGSLPDITDAFVQSP